jgi:hypothetical protein
MPSLPATNTATKPTTARPLVVRLLILWCTMIDNSNKNHPHPKGSPARKCLLAEQIGCTCLSAITNACSILSNFHPPSLFFFFVSLLKFTTQLQYIPTTKTTKGFDGGIL